MAKVRPFKALRPALEAAALTASLPYDVYTEKEAREAVKGAPLSFLMIDRPETMFPEGYDMYAPEVYEAARDKLISEKDAGVYIEDQADCFYLYELSRGGRSQTGIVALSSVDDYLSGVVRKHERTVSAKEEDRVRHIEALSAQTGPILLAYRDDDVLSALVFGYKESHGPIYDFTSEDGVHHRVWKVDEEGAIDLILERFLLMDHTYIADGHHRAASAVRVSQGMRAAAIGDAPAGEHEYDYFLSVLFPAGELHILDYDRVVRDMGDINEQEFFKRLSPVYDIRYLGRAEEIGAESLRPCKKYDVGLYLDGRIYMMSLKEEKARTIRGDAVMSLDASVLQRFVLSDILSVSDPRNDERLEFVGGVKGMEGLIASADECYGIAFALYPTSMEELMAVADMGLLMPPKSTWFEPKLRSGLFIHEF